MPIEPTALAITPALLHAIMSDPLTKGCMRVPSPLSTDQKRIRQVAQHLPDSRIIRRTAVHVSIDGLKPSFELAPAQAAERLCGVDHEVHLGRGPLAGQRHQVLE